MRNKYLMHILVALVLICSILICGTTDVFGKYTGGISAYRLLAFTTFSNYFTDSIVVGGDDETPGDIVPGGDPSDKIWGFEDDEENRDNYGWDDATELVFTVENKTDEDIQLDVIVNIALPHYILTDWGRRVYFNVPYTLSEICHTTGNTAVADGYLSTYPTDDGDRAAGAISFNQVSDTVLYTVALVYRFYEYTVTIQTSLTLFAGHTHTYQFDFGLPYGESGFLGLGDFIRDNAAYYSIRVQARSLTETQP